MNRLHLGDFKAVIFDLDSTLTNTHMYPIHATTWVLEQCSENAEEVQDEYLRKLIDNYFLAIDAIVKGAQYQPPYDVVRNAMKKSLDDVCVEVSPKILDEGTNYFKSLHVELSTLHDGVRELLDRLTFSGIKLGIITNSFEGHSEQILKKLEIYNYFDTLVDGGDVQAYKPMKKPFELALSDLGVTPNNSLYVGDEFYADVVGSKRMGMACVWINTRGQDLEELLKTYGEEYQPDLIVDNIKQILAFL